MKANRNLQKAEIAIALGLLLLASLACGSNATPSLVSTSKPPATSANTSSEPTATSANTSSEPTATTQSSAPVSPQNYNVGDVISIGDHNMDVLGWEVVPGDDFNKPDAGKKFIAVDLIIVNKSQSSVSISSLMQMSLKDDTGQKYDVDLMATTAAKGGSIDGELVPGEKVRGKIGFQIPENVTGLQFVFDASIFGTGKLFVNLGSAPVSVEPPASLGGEIALQTYKVGDNVAIGTVVITVNSVTSPAGDQFNKPTSGNKFLVLDVTIENKGTSSINVSTLMQMAVKDNSAIKYGIDISATTASGGSSPDGEISAGEKVRGQVGFQVPANAAGLVFVFDASSFGTGKVFIALP